MDLLVVELLVTDLLVMLLQLWVLQYLLSPMVSGLQSLVKHRTIAKYLFYLY